MTVFTLHMTGSHYIHTRQSPTWPYLEFPRGPSCIWINNACSSPPARTCIQIWKHTNCTDIIRMIIKTVFFAKNWMIIVLLHYKYLNIHEYIIRLKVLRNRTFLIIHFVNTAIYMYIYKLILRLIINRDVKIVRLATLVWSDSIFNLSPIFLSSFL